MRYIILTLISIVSVWSSPIAPPEYDTPNERLFFFVCDGSIEGVDAALAEGADINALIDGSCTALQLSIFQENQAVFDHLLKQGADVHVFSKFGNCNALSIAAIYDRKEMAKKLLQAGADPNAAEDAPWVKQYSAIAYAALYGNLEMLKLLEAGGGDLSRPLLWPMWRDLPKEFPLLAVAAQHGSLDVVRFLIEGRGHPVNREGKGPGLSPLSVAVKYDNKEVVKYLISRGADVNAVGQDYYQQGNHPTDFVSGFLSPLGVAARYGRLEMVRLLFAHGARVRENLNDAENPVHLADQGGFEAIVKEFEVKGHASNYWQELVRQAKSEHDVAPPKPVERFDSRFEASLLSQDPDSPISEVRRM